MFIYLCIYLFINLIIFRHGSPSTILANSNDILWIWFEHSRIWCDELRFWIRPPSTRIRSSKKTHTFFIRFSFPSTRKRWVGAAVSTENGDFRKRLWKWRLLKTETFKNASFSCGQTKTETFENGVGPSSLTWRALWRWFWLARHDLIITPIVFSVVV